MSNDQEVFFPAKWAKVIKNLPEFKETADAASAEDLKKIILTCESNLYEVAKAKESDQKLNAAKESVKEWSAPYKESLREQTARIQYALFLLEGKGVDMSDSDKE
jgi:hypothetical protein